MKDIVSYFKKFVAVELKRVDKESKVKLISVDKQKHIEKQGRQYNLLINRFIEFMSIISKDENKLEYLESRWGSSKWLDGEEIDRKKALKKEKPRVKPNIKNLAYFFKDLELSLTNVKEFITMGNMDTLRQLCNIYYGQQHGFSLQTSDIDKIKRIRNELS